MWAVKCFSVNLSRLQMWTFSSCKSGKHSFHLHGRESKVVRPARENSCWGTRTQGWDLSVQDHDSAVVTSVVKAGWYKARAFAEHIQKRHNLTLFLNKLIQQQYNEQKMSCLDTRERREERDWSTLCNIATYDSCSISVSSRRDASRPALCNLQKASVSFFNPQPWRRSGWMPRPSTERRLNINLSVCIYKTVTVCLGSAKEAPFMHSTLYLHC